MNAVERRLLQLRERWELFRDDPTKRVLIWRLPENARRMAEAFFEIQQHESAFSSGDLFIVLDEPFETSIQYSRALKEAFAGRYAASRDALLAEGIQPDWRFPHQEAPDTAAGFVTGLSSFASHHPDIGHVAAVLLPATVSEVPFWIEWLGRVLRADAPERVRYVLLDSLENPQLEALGGSSDARVLAETIHIDAWETAQETFAQEPASGAPGVFRALLVGLFGLVEKGSADQVMLKATDALAFAQRQQWPDQEIVVRMLAAGAMLKERRFEEAVNHYRHARKATSKLTETHRAVAGKLILQTWFGEAGAHFCAGDALQAARCYDESIPVAEAIPDVLLCIEALRMSTQSYLQASRRDIALDRSLRVLDVGERLPAEQRLASTLPLALLALLRLIEPDRVAALESIKHRLDEDQARVRLDTERRAAALERHPNPRALRDLEAASNAQSQQLAADAARRQLDVAAGGGELFRSVFRRTTELLAPDWLIRSTAILPAAEQGAARKRGTAS